MDRLTEKIGLEYCLKHCLEENPCIETSGICLCDECSFPKKAYQKLGKYEDLGEQGRLLELPCSVGDTVYKIYPNDLTDRVLGLTVVAFSNKAMELYGDTWTSFDKIGKTVFLTREEAEAALKESGKDKG